MRCFRLRDDCLPFVMTCLIVVSGLSRAGWSQPPATVNVEGLGRGTAELNGPRQFHIGDDMDWAQPGINDATGQGGWESIRPDLPWGAQGHYAHAGYGWYRLHLHVTPAAGFNSSFRLLIPRVENACEVYWNGELVGRRGTLPPHPSWPALEAPVAFALSGKPDGVLAIRVWKGSLGSSSSG